MKYNDIQDIMLVYEPKLKDYALNLTCDSDKAKDLVQDTYLKALRTDNLPKRRKYILFWMFSIMKNTFINDFRKKKRSLLIYNNTYSSMMDNLNNSEDNDAENRLKYEELNKALETLSDRFKAVFILYAQGYKYREISEKLNLPIDNIRTRIFVTRHILQEQLKEYRK